MLGYNHVVDISSQTALDNFEALYFQVVLACCVFDYKCNLMHNTAL